MSSWRNLKNGFENYLLSRFYNMPTCVCVFVCVCVQPMSVRARTLAKMWRGATRITTVDVEWRQRFSSRSRRPRSCSPGRLRTPVTCRSDRGIFDTALGRAGQTTGGWTLRYERRKINLVDCVFAGLSLSRGALWYHRGFGAMTRCHPLISAS